MDAFKDKRILIAGLGKSGTAAFDALVRSGSVPAVCDDRDIEKEEPLLFEKLLAAGAGRYFKGMPVPDEKWDYVIMSPGVPPSAPFAERARARGSVVIGELELSRRIGRGRYAAITGTNGKTTTTTLVGEIFRAAGLKTAVCGNIGTPVVSEAVDADDDTWLVTEVSSYQLETIDGFRPKIAAVLNLTPDHMDRHKSMENYAAAKARLFENQEADDVLIYNADDEQVCSLIYGARSGKIPFSRTKVLAAGAFVSGGVIVFADPAGNTVPVIGAEELRIPGAHNLENALASAAAAFAAGVDHDVTAKVLKEFKGVEHRLEFVAEVDGVRFVNDSKGTNPDASVKAIDAVGNNILLIAGGYDKDADFTDYVRAAKGRVKKFLLLGTTAEKIRNCALAEGFAPGDVIVAGSMEKAVSLGREYAEPGDTVLLSPACASWDMFKDFEERGDMFRELVLKYVRV